MWVDNKDSTSEGEDINSELGNNSKYIHPSNPLLDNLIIKNDISTNKIIINHLESFYSQCSQE